MSRRRVLLLEDDLALRSLLHEALAGEGFDVREFETYQEVRDAAAGHAGDLVVADFWGGSQRTLPEGERQEIHELCSFLPVVLLTGRTWAAETTAEELGARALIRKPFDLDHLLDTIAHALSEAQA